MGVFLEVEYLWLDDKVKPSSTWSVFQPLTTHGTSFPAILPSLLILLQPHRSPYSSWNLSSMLATTSVLDLSLILLLWTSSLPWRLCSNATLSNNFPDYTLKNHILAFIIWFTKVLIFYSTKALTFMYI